LKEASKKLKVSTTKIQEIAQRLFENGLITYIRTDAEVLSQDFLNQAESFFSPLYKDLYQKRSYEAKNSQAEAHEAIRITHTHTFEDLPEVLRNAGIKEELDKKLYNFNGLSKVVELGF
ncbi:DNA topoisomerase, partial [Campylobacter lari]|uniref:DNA topoisomerase n=1 Tax=Campylobacter lari TaxID=201 RepID=UPI00372D337C